MTMKRFYEDYWKNPDEFGTYVTEDGISFKRIEIMRKEIGTGKKILDVGCGNGAITNEIKKAGNTVVGMDISERAVNAAKKRFSGIKFIVSAADDKFPFKKGEFDVLFSGDVIEHVPETGFMLDECARVLKKGGKIIITTPYHGLLKNMLTAILRFDEHFNPEGAHLRFFTVESIKKSLEKRGFKIEKFYFLGRIRPLTRDMVIVARKTR